MRALILNVVFFQAGWFACVLGASAGWPALGPLVVALWLLLHLASSGRPRAEIATIVAAGLIGYAADSLLVMADVLAFPSGARLGGPSPLWMVALWMNLAGTLGLSMRWLRGRPLLAALFGAIGAPLSYLAGARLGAAQIAAPFTALAGGAAGMIAPEPGSVLSLAAGLGAIALEWAIAMPLLLAIADALDRRAGTRDDPSFDRARRTDALGVRTGGA